MKNIPNSEASKYDSPPRASGGIGLHQALEARWAELTEQHWDVLLFWANNWMAKNASASQRTEVQALLMEFALDYWMKIKEEGRCTDPLHLNELLEELRRYLALST
jgi:hypothetical protein